MNNTSKVLGFAVIAAISFTALWLTACPEPEPEHVHQWGEWTVTTPATETEEGEETRICALDPAHKETRPISRIPFTSVAGLETWLTSQPANTAATAYTIALNIDDEDDFSALFTTLNSATGKYIYLDLSGSTIETIPDYAFYGTSSPFGCTTLTGIIIPNSVESIGDSAFANCSSLSNVTIPNSVISIGETTFYNCTSLTSVTIPDIRKPARFT